MFHQQKNRIKKSRIAALFDRVAGVHCSIRVLKKLEQGAKFALFPALCLLTALWLGGCITEGTYPNVTHFSTVVIDPGHGGHDSGAVSRGGTVVRTVQKRHGRRKVITSIIPGVRVLEKDLALDVALRVSRKLRAAGLRTVMTRHDDTFIPLDDRADISNAHHDSIFVSIHFNDTRRREIHGMETYQNGRGTDELAHRIERAVAACPSGANRGVRHANYRVLRKSRGPAVLVECGYLSNAAEAAHCATPAFREQIAANLAQAILDQRRP